MKVVWHVDVDLGHLRKVSRQHALIIYNFEDGYFEIKCLSRKYPVYVNRQPLTFNAAPRPIHSGSIIAISSESFYFLLPPRLNQPMQHQLLHLQGGILNYVQEEQQVPAPKKASPDSGIENNTSAAAANQAASTTVN